MQTVISLCHMIRSTRTQKVVAAAEIATLRQQLAAAEARIREIEDRDNAFKPLTWKSDKTKSVRRIAGMHGCAQLCGVVKSQIEAWNQIPSATIEEVC
jgi:hypothetical protein